MKKAIWIIAAFLVATAYVMLVTSCRMSEREYQLRKYDIEARKAHPVYAMITIKGPLELKEGAVLEIPIQLTPYQSPVIPDGQQIWANVVQNGVTTAALAATMAFGVHEVRRAKGTTNTTINNNNAVPAQ